VPTFVVMPQPQLVAHLGTFIVPRVLLLVAIQDMNVSRATVVPLPPPIRNVTFSIPSTSVPGFVDGAGDLPIAMEFKLKLHGTPRLGSFGSAAECIYSGSWYVIGGPLLLDGELRWSLAGGENAQASLRATSGSQRSANV